MFFVVFGPFRPCFELSNHCKHKQGRNGAKALKYVEKFGKNMFFYGFGRLPIDITPELHFNQTKL